MKTRVLSAHNELSKMHIGSGIAVVDSITEPIKVLKILMEGLAPTKGAGYWIIRFHGLPIARSFSPFDLVYLDDEFRVLHTVEITRSSDFVPFKGIPSSALVLPPGSIVSSKTFNGDTISLRPDTTAPAASEQLPAQLASLAARGMQAASGGVAARPKISITPASDAEPPAAAPPTQAGVLRPARKHDAAIPAAKAPAPATPATQPRLPAADEAVLHPPKHAPVAETTQAQPTPGPHPATSAPQPPATEPRKAAAPQAPPAAAAPTPASTPPSRETAPQPPTAVTPAPVAAPQVLEATAQAPPATASPAAPPPQSAAPAVQQPRVGPAAPQPAPAPSATQIGAKADAPAVPVNPPQTPASPVAATPPIAAGAKTPPPESIAAPAPAAPPPQSAAPVVQQPRVAPAAPQPAPAPSSPPPQPPAEPPRSDAEPPASDESEIDSAAEESGTPTVVMHGTKLTQDELFRLLGADKAFDLVELAPEWPGPAPSTRQKRKQPPSAPKKGTPPAGETELPPSSDADELALEEESTSDAIIEMAAKRSELQKTEAKLSRRLDVKLLYTLFPELHPSYRPEFQVPYVDFLKYVNNPEERDKLTMKVQVLSWLYPELELETVEQRQREHRRAPRVADPGLVGYYFSSGHSQPHPIRNFSVWGFYMITEEKWLPGTIIRLTLQVVGSDGTNPGDTLTVHARVVNWDKQGAGFEFVLPGFLEED